MTAGTGNLDDLAVLLAGLTHAPALAGWETRLVMPREPDPVDLIDATRAALDHPVGAPRLSELAAGKRTAVIVTSDATRAVPNKVLLPLVLDQLAAGGITAADVTVLIALGAHRPLTASELAELLGAEQVARLRVVNHDARGSCVTVGRTSTGNEVRVARSFAQADVRVALGLVEPHEFAGFTGGGKSVLPGVAGHDSIIRNHSLELLMMPGTRAGEVATNPIRREMDEAARLSGLQFIVNVSLDRQMRPLAVAAGDPLQAHAELTRFVTAQARVDPPEDIERPAEPPELVVTGPGRPLDVNLYQSVKALVATEPWVGERSAVVLLSRCREGDGSREMLEPFHAGATPREVIDRLASEYTIEKDHSYFIARFLARCPTVLAYCPGVPADTLTRLGFVAATSVDEAISMAAGGLPGPRDKGAVAGDRPSARRRPLAILVPSPQHFLLAPWAEAAPRTEGA